MTIRDTRKYKSPDGTIASYIIVDTSEGIWVFAAVESPNGEAKVGGMSEKDYMNHITELTNSGWEPVK